MECATHTVQSPTSYRLTFIAARYATIVFLAPKSPQAYLEFPSTSHAIGAVSSFHNPFKYDLSYDVAILRFLLGCVVWLSFFSPVN